MCSTDYKFTGTLILFVAFDKNDSSKKLSNCPQFQRVRQLEECVQEHTSKYYSLRVQTFVRVCMSVCGKWENVHACSVGVLYGWIKHQLRLLVYLDLCNNYYTAEYACKVILD